MAYTGLDILTSFACKPILLYRMVINRFEKGRSVLRTSLRKKKNYQTQHWEFGTYCELTYRAVVAVNFYSCGKTWVHLIATRPRVPLPNTIYKSFEIDLY